MLQPLNLFRGHKSNKNTGRTITQAFRKKSLFTTTLLSVLYFGKHFSWCISMNKNIVEMFIYISGSIREVNLQYIFNRFSANRDKYFNHSLLVCVDLVSHKIEYFTGPYIQYRHVDLHLQSLITCLRLQLN